MKLISKILKKLKRVNRGGFGVVYSVEEKETNKIYSAKIIDCNDDEEQSKQMINREIAIMMSVNHPTIIKFYGYSLKDFQDEFNITILMQFAKNGSLDFVLKNIQNSTGPKYYDNTIRQIILIGVSRAMKYLHDRKIIHNKSFLLISSSIGSIISVISSIYCLISFSSILSRKNSPLLFVNFSKISLKVGLSFGSLDQHFSIKLRIDCLIGTEKSGRKSFVIICLLNSKSVTFSLAKIG